MRSRTTLAWVGAALSAAALTAAPQAAAQASQITVYGRVDLGYRYDGEGNEYGNGVARHQVANGSNNALGFKGVEDLGGGLAAFFHLEHRLQADTGTANAPFWDEISIVGLRGSFGEIRLGRQGGPYGAAPDPDAFGGDTVGGRGERKAGADDKYNNGFVYATPDFNGFSAALGVSLGEGGRRGTSGVLKYAAGPLLAAVSFADRANEDQAWALGGSYDFGAAKVLLALARNDGDGSSAERTTVDLGAIVPMGPGSLRAKFNHDDNDGVTTRNLGIGYWYDLSKRTMLYTDLGLEKREGFDRITRFDAGIRHNF